MTKVSKQRARVYAESCDNESGGFLTHQLEKIREKAYLKGMQDPDANAEKIANLERELGKPYDKVDRLFESNKKLLAENKKLREAIDFAIGHLSSMENYSIVSGAIHALKESKGGE